MAPGSAGCLCLQQEVLVQIPACRNVTVFTIVHLFVSVYLGVCIYGGLLYFMACLSLDMVAVLHFSSKLPF